MAKELTTVKIIKGVMNNDKCNLSIWDPCPAAVSWGHNGDGEMVQTKKNVVADVAINMEENLNLLILKNQ